EMATALVPAGTAPQPSENMQTVATPGIKTIDGLAVLLAIDTTKVVKTLFVKGKEDGALVALVLRGDHQLNVVKAQKLQDVAVPLQMADEKQVRAACGASFGSLGPVGLTIPIIVDHSAAQLADFCCGANEDGAHFTGVNWGRDCALTQTADLREIVAGDPSPDGKGHLQVKRGIEVGHIFQLGTKYSDAMNAKVLNQNGKNVAVSMGCYGIGVRRIVAAAIEQNHDERGISWPEPLAPFELALLPMNAKKSPRVKELADQLYAELSAAGVDVLYDDRGLRPGVMFNDMELIGIPHRLVIGERGIDEGRLEYRRRSADSNEDLPLDDVLPALLAKLGRA
ncbi:MAG: proline--tRNA ligase, partial [Xanthomonadales bacterium]|nr:proline--tRNA ligase [Xanthomonadales bacterium]